MNKMNFDKQKLQETIEGLIREYKKSAKEDTTGKAHEKAQGYKEHDDPEGHPGQGTVYSEARGSEMRFQFLEKLREMGMDDTLILEELVGGMSDDMARDHFEYIFRAHNIR